MKIDMEKFYKLCIKTWGETSQCQIAIEEMAEFAERSEAFGEAFDALGRFPPEYREALENEPKCQEIRELMPE